MQCRTKQAPDLDIFVRKIKSAHGLHEPGSSEGNVRLRSATVRPGPESHCATQRPCRVLGSSPRKFCA